MRVIGITGGIGGGKSAATDYLAGKGFPVIDADVISRQLAEPGQAGHEAMVCIFGEAALLPDGRIDRSLVARMAFADGEKLAELNAAIHALVMDRARELIEECRLAGEATVFLSAPLLFEAGMDAWTDQVWLVDAEEGLRLKRAALRDGASAEDVRRRMAAQMASDERRRRAHRAIDNSGSLEDLRARLDEALAEGGLL